MLLTRFISSVETLLLTIEASNVIALRLQMFSKGDAQVLQETELMVSEKIEAFAKASSDLMAGKSNSVIRNNLRAVIQANEARLNAMRLAA